MFLNTSRLETYFSWVRARGLDTISNYSSANKFQVLRKACIGLKCSRKYNYGEATTTDTIQKVLKCENVTFNGNI